MKKNIYISLLVSLLALAGCTTDTIESLSQKEGVLHLSMGISTDELNLAQVRSGNPQEEDIKNLKVLVFDENQNFIYSRAAILGGESGAPLEDEAYFPDGNRNEIERIKSFQVDLLSSNKKRYLHLVANYNWKGFPQDYFLEGKSVSEVIPSLKGGEKVFWSVAELEELQESTLQGKVFKLLRNYAKLTVDSQAKSFILTGYTAYYPAKEGTAAPFVFNTVDLSYNFPFKPMQPTLPANLAFGEPRAFSTEPLTLFERSNQGETPMFVLVKGYYENAQQPSYYKIDIKQINSETGVTTLHDIIRNTHYSVKIGSVATPGYSTAKEAAERPASNNLFASVELADFPSVSDGNSALQVDRLGGFITKPQEFRTSVYYTHGVKNIKTFPSWSENNSYVESYELTPNELEPEYGVLIVRFKDIPKEGIEELKIDLVGHPDLGSMSGLITRQLKFQLRQPYAFQARIEHVGDYQDTSVVGGQKINRYAINFQAPNEMPKTIFPFEVKIEADWITPDKKTPEIDNHMHIKVENGKFYYSYQVTEADRGKTVQLNFIRSVPDDYYQPRDEYVTLTSLYFKEETIKR